MGNTGLTLTLETGNSIVHILWGISMQIDIVTSYIGEDVPGDLRLRGIIISRYGSNGHNGLGVDLGGIYSYRHSIALSFLCSSICVNVAYFQFSV